MWNVRERERENLVDENDIINGEICTKSAPILLLSKEMFNEPRKAMNQKYTTNLNDPRAIGMFIAEIQSLHKNIYRWSNSFS